MPGNPVVMARGKPFIIRAEIGVHFSAGRSPFSVFGLPRLWSLRYGRRWDQLASRLLNVYPPVTILRVPSWIP
jgi:hypothetical protein